MSARLRTILAIEPYYITQKELYVLNTEYKHLPYYHLFKKIPEFCVRTNNGNIDRTEIYHQFTLQSEPTGDNGYNFFNATPVDALLQHEVSENGLCDLLKDIDFHPIFSQLTLNKYDDRRIPTTYHVVIDLIYEGEYEDVELFPQLIGYLDYNLKLIEI